MKISLVKHPGQILCKNEPFIEDVVAYNYPT